MAEFEFTGKTVEQAIEEGLKKLKKTKEEVQIKILDEGKSGLFGLKGSNEAKVKIICETDEEKVFSIIKQILKLLKIDGRINVKEENGEIKVNISSSKSSILIGREGKTLEALEFITSLILNKNRENHIRINLDIENYKKKKLDKLKNFIERKIPEVLEKGEKIVLQPMPSWERKFVYIYLDNRKDIKITTEGEGKNKKLILSKK